MVPEARRCGYRMKSGRRCRAARLAGRRYCVFHDPRARAQRRQVTRRARLDLGTAEGLQEWLSGIAEAVRAGKLEPRSATAMAYIGQVLAQNLPRVTEERELEERMAEPPVAEYVLRDWLAERGYSIEGEKEEADASADTSRTPATGEPGKENGVE